MSDTYGPAAPNGQPSAYDGIMWSNMPASAVRRPRLQIIINGSVLSGCFAASVSSNNHLAADKWDASLAMDADPDHDWAWWGSQGDITVDIQVGFIPDGQPEGSISNWTSLVTGKVDDMHVDPVAGLVTLSGRDLTAAMIDTKIQNAFANKTTSQILTQFAQEHSWTADVTPTTTLVGSYYKDEHDKLSLGNFSKQTSEWELACYLARQEDEDIWVDATGLHTKPSVDPGGANAQVFPLFYVPREDFAPVPTVNMISDIKTERSLTIAKDIRVTVKTWDSAHKSSYTKTVDGKGSITSGKGKGAAASMQTYVYVKPGLTTDQALAFAQKQARILTLLERIVTIEMPGELNLTPRSLVSLSGTGTSWDQTYYVDTISRKISWDGGFTQTVRLKNSSPRTMTTVS